MKVFLRGLSLLVAAAVLAVSCGKDEESGKLSFESSALYFRAGETKTVRFSASHVSSISVSSKPEKWSDPVLDVAARTLRITAPDNGNKDAVQSGSVVISGIGENGKGVTSTLFVSVSDPVDLSAEPANCYLVNRKETNYLFDVMHAGDGRTTLQTADVQVIWQTSSGLIQHLKLDNGKASFYIGTDKDTDRIQQGNALIGAFDAQGKLLWSWHVWATDYDPEQEGGTVTLNGSRMMVRNLGALDNSNASTTEILNSYGLYYQWGRKDPFVGPTTYRFNNGTSAAIYNGDGGRVNVKAVASSAKTGTESYARENPLHFITGAEENGYDWMWEAGASAWKDEEKGANDPCPAGWRVAPASAFAGLEIADPLVGVSYETYMEKFGWTLTDGTNRSLFPGGGRRSYLDGAFHNVYVNPDTERQSRNGAMYDQPWIGLYWTASTAGRNRDAVSLYFYFNKLHVERSRVEGLVNHARANGMPVRCVKERR